MEQPIWKKLFVESNIPEKLTPLKEISRNLWWVWNTEARELFQYIDAEIWEECEHNPIVLLDEVNYQRFLELEKDEAFFDPLSISDACERQHTGWFAGTVRAHNGKRALWP